MTEDRLIEEVHNLHNELDDLKKIVSLMEDVRITDNEIIKLQRKNISHLKMIADDRRVTINQMNQERWSVRKLDEDRYKHEFGHVITDNISKNFTEDRIDDMDCGDPYWGDIV